MRAIVGRDIGHHLIDQAAGLHGAQGFVVDGDGARCLHGQFIAFDENGRNTRVAEQIGKGQSGRAGADDEDVAGFVRPSLVRRSHLSPLI